MSKVKITSTTLNIREQPNAQSKAAGKYKKGDVTTIIAEIEKQYLKDQRYNWLLTEKGWIAQQFTEPHLQYDGPMVNFTPAIHAPGSDWMWQTLEVQELMRFLNIPVKFLSIGFSPDYWADFHKPEFHLVRIYWQADGKPWTPEKVWRFNQQRFPPFL